MAADTKIHEIENQIEALKPAARVELLRRVLTPELELHLLVDELSLRSKSFDPDVVARDVDDAVREVRRQHQRRASA